MTKGYVYKKRLLKLADKLDWVHKHVPHQFDYNQWIGLDWEGKADLSCGTSACALGWATTIKSFRRLGLRVPDNSHSDYNSKWAEMGMEIFGLWEEGFRKVFVPSYSGLGREGGKLISAKQVASHIREFVKEKYPDARKRSSDKRS